jgi:hypothetical protein
MQEGDAPRPSPGQAQSTQMGTEPGVGLWLDAGDACLSIECNHRNTEGTE